MRNLRTSNQAGMVSIMVTMLLMVVISLIVLGFAQLSRREQTEALDRQLSTQAFLAAESGVNDARRVIQQHIADGTAIPPKINCGVTTDYPTASANPALASGVSYSCLLVKTEVHDLVGDVDPNGSSIVLPIESDTTIHDLKITWKLPASAPSSNVAGCANSVADKAFPKVANWNCPYGVLRAEFVPTTSLSRSAMVSGQKVTFLYPVKGSGSNPDFSGIDSTVTPMKCTSASCTITLKNFNASKYMVKMTPLYKAGSFIIATDDDNQKLLNAQVQIDATGRAQDVLRRIQVRIPVDSTNQGAEQAISSGGSICKRYQYDGSTYVVEPIPGYSATDINPMCRPLSVVPPPPVCPRKNDIMLALDVSESMSNAKFDGNKTRYDVLQEMTNDFIDQTIGVNNATSNHIGMITFGGVPRGETQPKLVNFPMSGDATELHNDVKNFPSIYGTQYLPPLKRVPAQFSTGDYQPEPKTRYLIFVSDGETTTDVDEVEQLADQYKQAGIVIYTIAIGDPDNVKDTNFQVLRDMAKSKPGAYNAGQFFEVTNRGAFQGVIKKITTAVNCPG